MPKADRHPQKTERGNRTETAGHLAIVDVPVFSGRETAAAVRQHFKTATYEYSDVVIVVDGAGLYQGLVELGRLLAADDNEPLSALARRGWPTATPETDQEHAAEHASAASVGVLPVVTGDGRVIGIIPPPVLLDVLAREHREDMHRFVGILRERAGALHALEDPPLQRVARRLPWLLVGLVLSTAVTGIMAGFAAAIQSNILIAFFIPALVYLTDAIGTQTEAIAIRGLSMRQKPLPYILVTEILTGGLIGLGLGVVAFLGVWAAFGDPVVGLGVGLSLCVAGTLASAIGLLLPWGLSRASMDPAFGSGPVATIIQDALTILTYFLVMTALLPGVAGAA